MQPPLADRTDIRPLTVPVALQILLAKVFDAWTLPLPATMPDKPVGVAMLIVRTFLQAVPTADADPQVFSTVHDQLVANLEQGVDRAQAVVATWHDVPREAVDAVREARVMVFAALGEDAENPMLGPWVMRPEWLVFTPRIELLRRRLQDPDMSLPDIDDDAAAG